MSTKKVLYHYTSLEHAKSIIEAGYIRKTPSNLLRPKNLSIVNGVAVDPATDDYFPVVWMTNSESPDGLGIETGNAPTYRDIKKRVRISIPMKPYYTKWSKWAKQHNMEPGWKKCFTAGLNWQSWYVSELEIPLKAISEILDLETNTAIHWE